METHSWITLTILLTILATLLQIAGFVAPMWIWLDVDTFRVGVGLWFTTGCGLKGTCNTTAPTVSFGYTTDDTWAKPEFNAVRGLETVAVAGSLLLLFFLIVYKVGYGKWTSMDQLNMASFITAILTWMCILAGLIVFCAYYWPVVGTSPLDVSPTSFPWSLFLCLMAALFFIIVCALIRVKCRRRDYLKHAIPISGDTKMDLHPLTKHGLLHRYFSPGVHGIRKSKQAAIGYHTGTNVHSMNRRLISAEERQSPVAAIDNVAFNINTLENNVNYRYIPNQNGTATHNHSETVVRRTLPTAVVTYVNSDVQDHRHHHQQAFSNQQTAANHVTETSTNQILRTGHDVAGQHVNGAERVTSQGMSRNIVYDQNGDVRRSDVRVHGNRDVAGTGATVEEHVSYTAVTRPVVTTSTTYVTDAARETRLLGNRKEANFVAEGRDANYIAPTTETQHNMNRLMVKQVDSTDKSFVTGYHATQMTQTLATRTSNEVVKPYDPTYIYRPYAE